jgi:hypothetical protein
MSFWKDETGHPGGAARFILSAIGAAFPLIPPVVIKLVAIESSSDKLLAKANAGSFIVILAGGMAWLVSVIVCSFRRAEPPWEVLLASMGILGFILSWLGLGSQLIIN